MSTMRPHYSGGLSVPFWRRVNALKDSNTSEWKAMYQAGCLLQNMEGDVLRWLANAENHAAYVANRKKRK